MNLQGIKATVPPRIFIQTRVRLGQKSQFNSKNYFLAIAKPWPCPMAICPKTLSLPALQLQGPCPACLD